jgi:uncharacterized protein (TIGR00251 family)
MRVLIHVRPGSVRTGVGGGHGDALVVRVRERAVDGEANRAVVDALARALGLHRRAVTIVTGEHSRRKLVELSGDDETLAERWRALVGNRPI